MTLSPFFNKQRNKQGSELYFNLVDFLILFKNLKPMLSVFNTMKRLR